MCTLIGVDSARVTAADIARLAGVGRAAVSNWRKRYDTFPAAVGGTAASPQFDLDQVEQWLAEQGKLSSVAEEDKLWRSLLAAASSPAEALAIAGDHLLGTQSLPFEPLGAELTALADKAGAQEAFEQLWHRFADLPGQRSVTTPDALGKLMVTLADVRSKTVLDPACGTGRLLRAAAAAGADGLYGQDNDPAATRLASLWLQMNDLPGEIRTDDSLRHDAFPDLLVDAVVANLPFGLTNWGHEELGYDRRWEFGVPPRTEPELAWVQHALAHLKPEGTAVLLMPPSAASRRAGRRIRAELLRRGAIRAIIALPAGAAAPHAIGLHLWVLHRTPQATENVLLIDAGDTDPAAGYRRIVEVVQGPHGVERGDFAREISVIELLDEEVDLTPGRRASDSATGHGAVAALHESQQQLAKIVGRLPSLLPKLTTGTAALSPLPTVAISDLLRLGHLQLFGPVRTGLAGLELPSPAIALTSDDVLNGRLASGRAEPSSTPHIQVRTGDVVVPAAVARVVAHVVVDGGAFLGRGLWLLRCDPDQLDPWFLAGYLRSSANERQAGSLSSSVRLDLRKARVPRIPVEEQRRHGEVFRRVQEFDDAIRAAATISGDLIRRTADGLAGGLPGAAVAAG